MVTTKNENVHFSDKIRVNKIPKARFACRLPIINSLALYLNFLFLLTSGFRLFFHLAILRISPVSFGPISLCSPNFTRRFLMRSAIFSGASSPI